MKALVWFVFLMILPLSIFAKGVLSGRFDYCSQNIEKNGVRYELGQAWFTLGQNGIDSRPLSNYSVDYTNKPFAYHFTFNKLPKGKLWVECIYFSCGDTQCSPEANSDQMESNYQEVKKIPFKCQSKVKLGQANRLEYLVCKYDSDKK